MTKTEEQKPLGALPENAYRELKEGELYHPVMSPDKKYPEATVWSVSWGILMAILFSAAAAYLGLKIGQVFEAAIPIAIIAVGLSSVSKRKNALGENVLIQSIGSSSGVIVAGAIFTLPALYILQAKYPEMSVNFIQVFLSSLLGGILGILFLIPFRKYFVAEMHGKYPFPKQRQLLRCLFLQNREPVRLNLWLYQVLLVVCMILLLPLLVPGPKFSAPESASLEA